MIEFLLAFRRTISVYLPLAQHKSKDCFELFESLDLAARLLLEKFQMNFL